MMNLKTAALALVATAFAITACQESLEDRCAREAKEYTRKNCPALIERNTTMDSMTFDKATRTVTYAYTLSGELDDTALINRNSPRQLLLEQVRNSAHLKMYKEAGFVFRYVYYSGKKKGTKLFDASFHPSDYQ